MTSRRVEFGIRETVGGDVVEVAAWTDLHVVGVTVVTGLGVTARIALDKHDLLALGEILRRGYSYTEQWTDEEVDVFESAAFDEYMRRMMDNGTPDETD